MLDVVSFVPRAVAQGVPLLKVYQVDEEETREMDIESYLRGVVAGEMKNDWPEEALKAQAILARTFVIKFITEKQSKYSGADISTDIEEAQAYDAAGINERIRKAVEDTRGEIVCYHGDPIYAWFHAHSGGRTATASEGLSYRDEAPYTQSVESVESDQAPEDDAQWEVEFTQQQVIAAAADVGVKLGDSVKSVSAGERGESGRLKTIRVNGSELQANEFRIAIGSTEMKSTLITELGYEDGLLRIRGKGYGHGVGMSQWGAYAMAENGENAMDIINMYFKDVDIVQIWK
ncbi:MAG: SpoIID/LytB domain-containing protein [Atopobiaceae bacterium]|nr:SpoIID/LytB domain-containing protein [Atopobiaceae bacterium]